MTFVIIFSSMAIAKIYIYPQEMGILLMYGSNKANWHTARNLSSKLGKLKNRAKKMLNFEQHSN
jgi:hypothetical protein